MSLFALSFTTCVFLGGIFCLTAFLAACRRLPARDVEKQIGLLENLFCYKRLHESLFPKQSFEGVLFVTRCTLSLAQFGLALCIFLWLWHFGLLPPAGPDHAILIVLIALLLIVIPLFFFSDFLPRFLGMRYPRMAIKTAGPVSNLFLLAAFPISALFLKALQALLKPSHFEYLSSTSAHLPPEILQFVHEASIFPGMQAHDKELFESVVDFRKRLAREVMVPRIDVFSLPADTPIRIAVKKLQEEGYSRTPVYRNSIDDIIGVLMWKDVQAKYMEAVEKQDHKLLDAPIETITKPVLYAPETKTISNLLQEFRQKQVHLAIVVDEYGGTEGIVTIKDILEELVGDISDEYDDRETLYSKHPQGGWIIDPRMTILDLEEKLGVKIPQEGDYDTVAGYIFHCAGAIPTKGFVIHRDTLEIEILSSNDRSVDKVRIKTIQAPNQAIGGSLGPRED